MQSRVVNRARVKLARLAAEDSENSAKFLPISQTLLRSLDYI